MKYNDKGSIALHDGKPLASGNRGLRIKSSGLLRCWQSRHNLLMNTSEGSEGFYNHIGQDGRETYALFNLTSTTPMSYMCLSWSSVAIDAKSSDCSGSSIVWHLFGIDMDAAGPL